MKTCLGIELGSTRIKAVEIDGAYRPLSSGDYTWASRYENGVWTYPLEEVWTGLKAALAQVEHRQDIAAMGVSAMMHGYLAFDKDWNLLTPFRTWQNTNTGPAAAELTELFDFNIPQRWSIAHLYQAVLNGEKHVSRIAHLTTLAGYVHYMLTGVHAVGVGEASGMFPIDSAALDYDRAMMAKFDALPAVQTLPWKLADLLPGVLAAGEPAGTLTEQGAALLEGLLPVGIPFAPAEGDAGTGMTATNSVAPRTGNVSAGTSIFAMVVLERPLSKVYPELDLVATPTGRPVAMVHCNTCTSDLDAWVEVFAQLLGRAGASLSKGQLYDLLYQAALEGPPDCGGVVSYNCYAGEPVIGLSQGRPLLTRVPGQALGLGGFMRAQLFAAMAPLKIGMDLLLKEENAALDQLLGHGGLFKTPVVGQRLMAGALGVPVSVMETAGEGGPWGMAVLAMFAKACQKTPGLNLESYLAEQVFAEAKGSCAQPQPQDTEGFAAFLRRYRAALPVERLAGDTEL